jgi:biotin carboxyl carrier protein
VATSPQLTTFEDGDGRVEVGYRFVRQGVVVDVDGTALEAVKLWDATPGTVDISIDHLRRRFSVHRVGAVSYVDSPLGASALREVERFPLPEKTTAPGSLVAPMPGTVVRVLVEPGDRVAAGDTLIVLEAMKMEHQLQAPHSGTVAEVAVAVGDQVETGVVLAAIDEDVDHP